MKKIYDAYVRLSVQKRLGFLMLVLFIAYSLIDWLFDGNTAFTFKSNVQRSIEVIITTLIIDYALVAKSLRKSKKTYSENSTT